MVNANARWVANGGVGPDQSERAVEVIERSLAEEGPLTRAQLGERLAEAGIRAANQATIHLLMMACLRGIAVRGPMVDGQHAYVLVHDWLGEPKPVDRDRALAELARRYLSGHGPADDRDFARWAGLPLRDVRAGLKAIASELTERSDGLVDLAKRPAAAELPPPRLLGAFDPVLLGWCSREPILGSNVGVVTINGIFRPFVMVRGRGVGTWTLTGSKVTIKPFDRIAQRQVQALQEDAVDVARFLGSAGDASVRVEPRPERVG